MNDLNFSCIVHQINEEVNNSDENKSDHTLKTHVKYKRFEDDKKVYIFFLLQLANAYKELKYCSVELEYLYSSVFRYGDFKHCNVNSNIHLGFFCEIILSDELIYTGMNIAYTGLWKYQLRTTQVTNLLASIQKMIVDKTLFGEIWRKLETLYELHPPLNHSYKHSITSPFYSTPASENLISSYESTQPEKQELAKQKKRDKNRRKKQKKRLQKQGIDIKEEISEKLLYSIEAQRETMDLIFDQWEESFEKPIDDQDLMIELEEQRKMELFIARYKPLSKRLKPNISEESLGKMEEILKKLLAEC